MIRQGKRDDVEDILEIYNYAIESTTAIYAYKKKTLKEQEKWYDMKISEGYPVYVYEENGRVVGFSTYGAFRVYPGFKYTVEHSVYVHKDYGKRGIGTALLDKIILEIGQKEYATVIAFIDSENDTSIRLHEKAGFEYSGKITKAGYKFEKWLDTVIYQKNLSGPKTPTED